MRRTGMLLAIGLAMASLTLHGTQTVAATPPSPVTAVSVTGTAIPLEMTIAWRPPADPAYSGARVVIVPGATPTTDPQDARAVFRADVAAPASSSTWAGEAGHVYGVSVFGRGPTEMSWSAPASTVLRMPDRASHIVIDNYRNRVFTAFWVLGAGTDEAIVCFRRGAAPATVAEADACSGAGQYYASFEPVGAGSSTDPPTALSQFAVFGRSRATGLLAPAVADTGETPPPFPPTDLEAEAVTRTRIRLHWQGPSWSMGGYPTDRQGGQTSWLLYRFRGRVAPEERRGAVPVATVPASRDGQLVFLAKGLVPGATYTFALRGRDAEGNLSGWSNARTTQARSPGLYLVHDRAGSHRWRATKAAGPRATASASLIVTRAGLAHVVYRGGGERLRHAVLQLDGRWDPASAPGGFAYAQDMVVGPDGELAAIAWPNGPCVVVRRPAGWRPVRCLSDVVNDGQLDLVYDRQGQLHVIYGTEAGGLRYATNARGAWRTSRITSTGTTEAVLAYDAVVDALVVVLRQAGTDTGLSMAVKSAGDAGFGPPRVWVSDAQAVQPTAVASSGGRVTVAASAVEDGSAVPVIVSGRYEAGPGRLMAIRGAREGDSPQLAAMSRNRLVLAWTKSGAWSSRASWDAGRQAWQMRAPVRRTRSPYDQLLGVEVDGRGHTYLLVHRRSTDER